MKINILEILFELQTKKEILDEKKESLYGRIDFENFIIEINQKYIKEQQDCTLLHEILHGIDEYMQIKLKEKKIKQISIGLYNLLKNNKDFFLKYLKELK